MSMKKLVAAGALSVFGFAGPALAEEGSMGGMHEEQQEYGSTQQQGQQALGQQELKVTVKEVDRTQNKVTFEADLSSQASIQGQNQEQIQLSELSEGDEVRASFNEQGDITKLEVVSKGSEMEQPQQQQPQQQEPGSLGQEPSEQEPGSETY